ncbi:acyl-CoA dehydrogenase/oxidase [Flagelloscypha sp. PMI_526]|nr:acyl-CoA dehydrogenase/oxidase [Flagelloscypha sp. PMI_526]
MEPVTTITSSSPTNRQQKLLDAARRSSSFDVAKLTNIIYGSAEAAAEHERVRDSYERALKETNPTVLPRVYHGMDRKELYHDGLRWGAVHLREGTRQAHSQFTAFGPKYSLVSTTPYGHQFALFSPALKLLGDEEQVNYWWPLARDGKIVCTYAQTELGHGTFLRGLETTATLDEHTDEIVINTPTVTATKYWPGGMGYTASHAIVMARLIAKGVDHGIHAFVVQIRSLTDYKPMPGIEAGDIGMKIGWNSTDNGYLSFNHVRIPRRNMLAKNAQLARDGTYTPSKNDKLLYGGLTSSRVMIVSTTAFQLAQAATIATRYSFRLQVMMYKSQHSRLLKHIASSYAIQFSWMDLDAAYKAHASALGEQDLSKLAYTHFATAALKAFCTEVAVTGAEDCRRLLGGIGYSYLSGMPLLLVTLEGENYVMYQQAARYLIKAYPQTLLMVYRHRASRMLQECSEALRVGSMARAHEEVWNDTMMELIAAARAHIQLAVLEAFIRHVSDIKDPHVHRVMKHLCDLYALSDIENPAASGSLGFFEDGFLSHVQLREIRRIVRLKHEILIPEAVGLVDAWNFSDASLQSAVGQKDGNAYERVMGWTRQLPINLEAQQMGGVEVAGFEAYTQPVLNTSMRTRM